MVVWCEESYICHLLNAAPEAPGLYTATQVPRSRRHPEVAQKLNDFYSNTFECNRKYCIHAQCGNQEDPLPPGSAGVEWYKEAPHLKLRLNHVLRLHVPDIPEWKYLQVIGGGGLCEVGIRVVGSWTDLNKLHKECLYMFVSNFDPGTSIPTWDWIERHRLPVAERAGRGPAGDVAADEEDLEKIVVPQFCRARLYTDGKGLKRHPTMREHAYLHLAARACTQMLREQRRVSHGAGTGDAAKYSPFQFRVERMPLPGGWSDAAVALTFPAESDPDKMSGFQRGCAIWLE
ncbi:hypothetical protein CYMTET_3303 [Cymbomonas tetramitiformis]|uniref:Uncharacterized protein n=1 Tax=Cymbomonas tetramitiformis TaxID=36881 RepID=A0AAE0H3K8_9CHLO|nr:hypothetical protein CYMTET_3303 [Cymbomonas tetramitiformis]